MTPGKMSQNNLLRAFRLQSALFLTLAHLLLTIQNGDCHMAPESLRMLSPGTTKFLERIFKGRCSEYLDCTLPNRYQCEKVQLDSINCTASLIEFLNAFSNVGPCNVSENAYDDILTDTMVHSEENETLFWSGTRDIAVNMATVTSRYTTIERTLAGYILNGLMWCGQTNSGEVVYNVDNMCPSCPQGSRSATYQFWSSASRHFAAQARGYVSLLLDSTRTNGSFQNASTFSTQELPNINPENVKHVYIHLVRNVSAPAEVQEKRETCDTGSIKELKRRLEERELNFTCTEDDPEFIMIQCLEYQDATPCKQYSSSPRSSSFHLSFLSTILLAVAQHLCLSPSIF